MAIKIGSMVAISENYKNFFGQHGKGKVEWVDAESFYGKTLFTIHFEDGHKGCYWNVEIVEVVTIEGFEV